MKTTSRTLILAIFLMVVMIFVEATNPTDPTIIYPANKSIISDNNVTLQAFGVTDEDGHPLRYLFVHPNGTDFSNPKWYDTTCQNDPNGDPWYCHANITQLDEGGGNDKLGIGSGNGVLAKGDWDDFGDGGPAPAICEYQNTGLLYYNSSTLTYAQHNVSCRALNGSGWYLAVPSDSDENAEIGDLCNGATYCYIGGVQENAGDPEWYWDSSFIQDLTLQNSSNNSYDWTGLTPQQYVWTVQVFDNNSNASNLTYAQFNVSFINLNVTIYDEEHNTQITEHNFTVSVINVDEEAQNITLQAGKFNFTVQTPAQYRIRVVDTQNLTYYERNYYQYLPEDSFTQLNVYALNKTYSEVFSSDGEQIIVKDTLNNELEGAIVNVNKYFIGSNSFVTVERSKTNFEGTTLAHLTSDGFYRFIIEYPENTTVYSTESTQIFQEPINFVISLVTDPTDLFFNSNGIDYTLSFNNATNRFVFTYNDAKSVAESFCLNLYRYSGTVEVYEEQSCGTSQSGTLFVSLDDGNFTYLGRAYATLIGETTPTLLDTISTELGFTDPFGVNGWYIALILTIMVAFVGFWNLFIALILLPVPLLFLVGMDIIPMAMPVAIGIAVGIWVIGVVVGRRS